MVIANLFWKVGVLQLMIGFSIRYDGLQRSLEMLTIYVLERITMKYNKAHSLCISEHLEREKLVLI